MDTGTGTGMLTPLICLVLVAAFFVLAGCVADDGGNPTFPIDTNNTTVITPGSVFSEENIHAVEQKLNVTIHSAQKVRMIQGISPDNTRAWVIVDLSIENRGFPGGLALERNAIVLVNPATGQMYFPEPYKVHMIVDQWTWKPIAYNTTKRGEVLFVTNLSPDSYVLSINEVSGNPLYRTSIQTVRYREYHHTVSDTVRELDDSSNFTAVVHQLATPEKTLQYMTDTFIFTYHFGLISYPAEEFFQIRKGDCKDYAKFFSYVLDQHGYYAEIVSIRYSGHGHSVTIFKDDDGQLKYQSSDKMNGFRNVSSLDDLLQKETDRSNAGPILRYKVLPAGSTNMCTMPSGEC
jgi:hypothetical protein